MDAPPPLPRISGSTCTHHARVQAALCVLLWVPVVVFLGVVSRALGLSNSAALGFVDMFS